LIARRYLGFITASNAAFTGDLRDLRAWRPIASVERQHERRDLQPMSIGIDSRWCRNLRSADG
jgi:hypothetical protein